MDYYLLGNLCIIVGIIITLAAQIGVNVTIKHHKQIKNKKGFTGFDVARKILDQNGLQSVHVVETEGVLSDHYDPSRKVVRLSHDIFHGDSVSALAVAAHECGHAIQDKENYTFMRFRSFLVPFVNLSSRFGYFAILIGLIFGLMDLAWVGIALELVILLFQLVTLPVEINASKRARIQIESLSMADKKEVSGVRKVLTAAAFTYVASLLTNLLQILRLVLIVAGNDRD